MLATEIGRLTRRTITNMGRRKGKAEVLIGGNKWEGRGEGGMGHLYTEMLIGWGRPYRILIYSIFYMVLNEGGNSNGDCIQLIQVSRDILQCCWFMYM